MTKEELKSCLYKDYHYTSERIFKHKFLEEYLKIKSIKFPKSFSFIQKLYHYVNDDIDLNIGLCPVCGKRCNFKTFKLGYYLHCSSKCSGIDENTCKKRKETVNEKYGVDHVSQHKGVQERIKRTCVLHFGVENPSQAEHIKKKKEKTTTLRFGVKNPSQAESVKKKKEETCLKNYGVRCSLQSEEIKEKSRKTNIEKRGVPYPMQSEEIKAKSRKTNIEKRGVPYPMQSEEVKTKSKLTCNEKYGTDYTCQAEITKQHMMETNLEKHGVVWYCMHPDVKRYSNNSKPNRDFAKLLDDNGILYEREFALETFAYDFKIENFLVEINPTITHNVLLDIFGRKPISKDYHYRKTQLALSNGYMCIHVWDWTDIGKVIDILKNKNFEYIESHPVLHWYKTSSKSHIITDDDLSNDGYLPVYDDGNLCQI